jgi:hypothetical protein
MLVVNVKRQKIRLTLTSMSRNPPSATSNMSPILVPDVTRSKKHCSSFASMLIKYADVDDSRLASSVVATHQPTIFSSLLDLQKQRCGCKEFQSIIHANKELSSQSLVFYCLRHVCFEYYGTEIFARLLDNSAKYKTIIKLTLKLKTHSFIDKVARKISKNI